MAGKKEAPFFQSLEIPQVISDFLSRFPFVVIATTTRHKVSRAKEFLKLAGYNGEVLCLSAPLEPSTWVRPEEIAQEKVRQVAELPSCPGNSLIIGTDSTIAVNGDPSPLGKPYGEESDVYQQLLEIVGPQSLGVAELRIGVAAFLPKEEYGVFARIYYPFAFSALNEEEVLNYQRRHGSNVRKRAGGCDFAGEFAQRINAIGGVFQDNEQFPHLLADFKNAALGFPPREVIAVLEALATRNGGREPWLRIYPSNPLFSNR